MKITFENFQLTKIKNKGMPEEIKYATVVMTKHYSFLGLPWRKSISEVKNIYYKYTWRFLDSGERVSDYDLDIDAFFDAYLARQEKDKS